MKRAASMKPKRCARTMSAASTLMTDDDREYTIPELYELAEKYNDPWAKEKVKEYEAFVKSTDMLEIMPGSFISIDVD